MRRRPGKRWLIALVAGTVAAAVIGGMAWAIIPGPGESGVILACYQNQTGTVRLVDDFSACSKIENQTSWNQTGPAGLSGYEQVIGTWVGGTDTVKTAEASCGSGKNVLGGGYTIAGNNLNVFVWTNGPSSPGTWSVQANKNPSDGTNWTIVPYAVCATVAQ